MSRRVAIGSHVTVFVVVALGVAVFVPLGQRTSAGSTRHAGTSWPTSCPGQPDSIDQSATMSGDVSQSLDGSIVGCFRVPDDRRSTLHVALQSYVALLTGPGSVTPPKVSATSSTTSPDGSFTLSTTAHTVRPGERIDVSGHDLHGHQPANSRSATICWNGCESGLQEQGVTLHWISSTEFHAALVVPDAPWYVVYHGRPSVHPLASGTYTVGIECITSSSGCALGGADAQIHVHLVAPRATWCTARVPCGSLHLSTTRSTIGDVVEVRGRAPLVTLIGRPWGYWLDLSATDLGSRPLDFLHTGGAENIATVAPRNLTVEPGQTWESLHLSPVTLSSWSQPSSVNPSPTSPLVAWCEPGAVVVTGSAHPYRVPTTGAARVLALNHLSLSGWTAVSPCLSATVEPGAPGFVVATFDAAANNEIPPVYAAGLYTNNGGATWHLVPSPPGRSDTDYGGVVVVGRRIEALFTNRRANATEDTRTTLTTEATSNGGVTWSASTLGCPINGPCTVFGPFVPDNCAMTSQPESVLVGSAPGQSSGVRFSETRWVTEIDACYSQQLVATTTGLELLADPSSIYPLLISRDGGRTWHNVRLPFLQGLGTPGSFENSLVLASNDTLVASVETSGGGPVRLYVLPPRASSWCGTRRIAFASPSQLETPLRTNGDGLLWGQYPTNTPSPVVARHFTALSDLHCQQIGRHHSKERRRVRHRRSSATWSNHPSLLGLRMA